MPSELKKCWEHFDCDGQFDCPARHKCLDNNKCWRVAARSAGYIGSGVQVRDGLKECWNCDFFKLNNQEFFLF